MSKAANFAEYIAAQIDASDLKQNEIARKLGYDNPNIISMFKKGLTKVPINKLPILADILGINKAALLRRAMLEYAPEIWRTIEGVMGMIPTKNEAEILEIVRSVVGVDDPALTPAARKKFEAAAKALK